jgi:hypothetical protein
MPTEYKVLVVLLVSALIVAANFALRKKFPGCSPTINRGSFIAIVLVLVSFFGKIILH